MTDFGKMTYEMAEFEEKGLFLNKEHLITLNIYRGIQGCQYKGKSIGKSINFFIISFELKRSVHQLPRAKREAKETRMVNKLPRAKREAKKKRPFHQSH